MLKKAAQRDQDNYRKSARGKQVLNKLGLRAKHGQAAEVAYKA